MIKYTQHTRSTRFSPMNHQPCLQASAQLCVPSRSLQNLVHNPMWVAGSWSLHSEQPENLPLCISPSQLVQCICSTIAHSNKRQLCQAVTFEMLPPPLDSYLLTAVHLLRQQSPSSVIPMKLRGLVLVLHSEWLTQAWECRSCVYRMYIIMCISCVYHVHIVCTCMCCAQRSGSWDLHNE